MIKFLVLGAFLAQVAVNDCYGQLQYSPYVSESKIIVQSTSAPKNDSDDGLSLAYNYVNRTLDVDYVVTKGVGAHKLHVRKLSWAKAAKTCIEEGGHLAVIRTDLEEKIILGLMVQKSIDLAWVGYHDMFEEGDWFSVLGEPLAQTGWSRWSIEFPNNPIPNNGHCAELKGSKGGLVNIGCAEKRSFICKVSID